MEGTRGAGVAHVEEEHDELMEFLRLAGHSRTRAFILFAGEPLARLENKRDLPSSEQAVRGEWDPGARRGAVVVIQARDHRAWTRMVAVRVAQGSHSRCLGGRPN